MIRSSVLAAWHRFSEPFEGRVHSMYVDVLGLVTAGVGNLADPISLAFNMPWTNPDGSPASRDEIAAAWRTIKSQADRLKKLHYKYAAPLTKIRLTDEGIDELVSRKLASNAAHIATWFPGFAELPADAQLGILSMAWAVGPAFNRKFPTFTRLALAGQWRDAATASKIRETGSDGTPNPGVIPRNKANRLCFENTAAVLEHGADPGVLHWPRSFAPEPKPAAVASGSSTAEVRGEPLSDRSARVLQARLNEGLDFRAGRGE